MRLALEAKERSGSSDKTTSKPSSGACVRWIKTTCSHRLNYQQDYEIDLKKATTEAEQEALLKLLHAKVVSGYRIYESFVPGIFSYRNTFLHSEVPDWNNIYVPRICWEALAPSVVKWLALMTFR